METIWNTEIIDFLCMFQSHIILGSFLFPISCSLSSFTVSLLLSTNNMVISLTYIFLKSQCSHLVLSGMTSNPNFKFLILFLLGWIHLSIACCPYSEEDFDFDFSFCRLDLNFLKRCKCIVVIFLEQSVLSIKLMGAITFTDLVDIACLSSTLPCCFEEIGHELECIILNTL